MRSIKSKFGIRESSDMLRTGANRFVCRFHKLEDLSRILEKQPWQVLGHVILIEAFSTVMDAALVGFESIPLWMSFSGLELEHHSTETVRMIATAAGSVNEILPTGIIPRTAEGYRANVNANIHRPIVQGTIVNTLSKGDVWVSFKFNNLPSIYCITCKRIGHDKGNCTFSIEDDAATPMLMLGYHDVGTTERNSVTETSLRDLQSPLWPHEVGLSQGPTIAENIQVRPTTETFMHQPHLEPNFESPELKCKQLVQLWADSGLLNSDEIHALGLTPPPRTEPMIITKPNPNESNETLNLNQPNPTLDTISVSQIPNYAQFPNSTTNYGRCQENNQTPVVGESPIPARRRGRPPGSTNKKPNLSAKDKGKSVLIDEGDQGGAKKRKFD
ncbi:hypothetical protein FRX31_016808, partial [Thalictrum thalictroides]